MGKNWGVRLQISLHAKQIGGEISAVRQLFVQHDFVRCDKRFFTACCFLVKQKIRGAGSDCSGEGGKIVGIVLAIVSRKQTAQPWLLGDCSTTTKLRCIMISTTPTPGWMIF